MRKISIEAFACVISGTKLPKINIIKKNIWKSVLTRNIFMYVWLCFHRHFMATFGWPLNSLSLSLLCTSLLLCKTWRSIECSCSLLKWFTILAKEAQIFLTWSFTVAIRFWSAQNTNEKKKRQASSSSLSYMYINVRFFWFYMWQELNSTEAS